MPRAATSVPIVTHSNPSSSTSEAYRILRINIDFAGSEIKTIAVTSANRGEGKTTTSLNLAVAYAQAGKRVALVDADLRKPAVHLSFGWDNAIGLTSGFTKTNALSVMEITKDTNIDNLYCVTSGPSVHNPSELLASKHMDSLLDELKQRFDVVIVDTPPSSSFIDAKVIASKCDGVIIVVEHGKVKRSVAAKVKEDLQHVKANIIGTVFNKINGTSAGLY